MSYPAFKVVGVFASVLVRKCDGGQMVHDRQCFHRTAVMV